MNILINCSNLKVGGGIQVADSICHELFKFPQHHFTVVYSKPLANCAETISHYSNVDVIEYELPLSLNTTLWGNDLFLDGLVARESIKAVLTVFGPSRWRPKVPHLSGFAQGHIVLPDSPFWGMLPFTKQLMLKTRFLIKRYSLRKSSDYYFTENSMITERLRKLFPHKTIFTVTNNANQVFYHPQLWDRSLLLPKFDGITLLSVAANYPHKNLPIIIPTCHYLETKYPELEFRFILTINEEDLKGADNCARRHIVFLGPVRIQQVPFLYEQSDVMLLPTLLECFSASYAEAMVMGKPILTTDLIFAHGLCGNAALYYDALSFKALGDAIAAMARNDTLCKKLVANGKLQLMKFDSAEQRANKLIKIVESII